MYPFAKSTKLKILGFLLTTDYVGTHTSKISYKNVLKFWLSKRGVYPLVFLARGSVVGPLLFTVFINDISDNLQYTESLFYADDLKFWAQIFSSVCAIQLNSDIISLTLWADDNGMIFNLDKIKFMCFGQGKL